MQVEYILVLVNDMAKLLQAVRFNYRRSVKKMVKVELRLLGDMKALLPADARERGSVVLDAPDGVSCGEFLVMAGVAGEEPVAALVNGVGYGPDRPLKDGDVVSVFPPVARG